MPLISIIVPVYKVEPYLRECVDSILNQTFADFELILVDDGSPDNCPKICDEYARKDSRIVVIHKENGGLSSARNAGLDIAKGEYISFIDSDDCVNKDYLKVLISNLLENQCDISICRFVTFENHANYAVEKNRSVKIINDPLAKLECKNYLFIVSWAKIYKANLFERIRFPLGKINEDEYVAHEIYSLTQSVCSADAKLYFYRKRDDSIMSKLGKSVSLDYIDAIVRRTNYLLSLNKKMKSLDSCFKTIGSFNAKFKTNRLFCNSDNSPDLKPRIKVIRKLIRQNMYNKSISWKIRVLVLASNFMPKKYLRMTGYGNKI